MIMSGNIINAAVIVVGSLIGVLFKNRISERFTKILTEGLGIGITIYGISQGITTGNPLVLFLSLGIGALIGEWINIDEKLNQIGDFFQSKMKNATNVTQGFVSSSLIFCIGAMAIMGALQSGLQGNHEILYAKSFLDGTMSVVFASAMGIGVLLSAGTVFAYQGIIIVLSGFLSPYLVTEVITEMTAVGGVLIFAIGIDMLDIRKMKLGNLLPAIFVPIFLNLFMTL